MQKKTDIEMQRQRVQKITRAMLRLKYSLMADEEINNVLPDTLTAFDTSVQLGLLPELRDIAKLLETE